MNNRSTVVHIINWLSGMVILVIGLLNVFLVHPIPGAVYILLSFIYFPPANAALKKEFGFSIPPAVKTILGIVCMMFTLGVSELGEMID